MLKIGTDCSGIDAPIIALKKMNVDFTYEFASEIDEKARKTLLENHSPKKLFNDMTIQRKLPKVDIYICGFPCQPFSLAGQLLGKDDKRNIFDYCIRAIIDCSPTVFILENVKALTYNDYFSYIKESLNKLKEYNVTYNIYNTKDYGIPQNRERLYIIGIKHKKLKTRLTNFNLPKKKMKSIYDFIDKTDTHKDIMPKLYEKNIKKSNGVFIDMSFINLVSSNSYTRYSPTITRNGHMWCIPMHRKANVKELLKLQGFPTNFKYSVSDNEIKKQIGNSMSVNVLVEIFKLCFKHINF